MQNSLGFLLCLGIFQTSLGDDIFSVAPTQVFLTVPDTVASEEPFGVKCRVPRVFPGQLHTSFEILVGEDVVHVPESWTETKTNSDETEELIYTGKIMQLGQEYDGQTIRCRVEWKWENVTVIYSQGKLVSIQDILPPTEVFVSLDSDTFRSNLPLNVTCSVPRVYPGRSRTWFDVFVGQERVRVQQSHTEININPDKTEEVIYTTQLWLKVQNDGQTVKCQASWNPANKTVLSSDESHPVYFEGGFSVAPTQVFFSRKGQRWGGTQVTCRVPRVFPGFSRTTFSVLVNDSSVVEARNWSWTNNNADGTEELIYNVLIQVKEEQDGGILRCKVEWNPPNKTVIFSENNHLVNYREDYDYYPLAGAPWDWNSGNVANDVQGDDPPDNDEDDDDDNDDDHDDDNDDPSSDDWKMVVMYTALCIALIIWVVGLFLIIRSIRRRRKIVDDGYDKLKTVAVKT